MTPNNSAPALTDAERHFLQGLAAEFNRAWDGAAFAAQVRKLPPGRSAFRGAALRELVRIDLLRHWRAGNRRRLEKYLKALPELGGEDTVAPRLIQAEIDARRQSGAAVDPDQFARRFPRQFPLLELGDSVDGTAIRPAGPTPPRVPNRPRRRPDRGGAAGQWAWAAAAAGIGAVLVAAALAVGAALLLRGPGAPQAVHAPTAPPVPLAAAPPAPAAFVPDPDFSDPELEKFVPPAGASLTTAVAEFDGVGDARVRMELRLPPAVHAFLRRQFSRPLAALDKARDGQPAKANVLGMVQTDADEGVWEDVNAEFGEEVFAVDGRLVSCVKRRDGRWAYSLSADASEPFKLVSKKGGRVVVVRKVHMTVNGQTAVEEYTLTLPQGAHHVEVTDNPNRLVYEAPEPTAGPHSADKPVLTATPKPHILSALAKQYGDPRFGSRWAARSDFHNVTGEILRDYRVRFKLGAYSEWSDWSRADRVFPGQSVIDCYRPVIDYAKVRDLNVATPVDVSVEYEYVRPGGEKVADSQAVRTVILGMNEAVYSEAEITPDSTWYEVFQDAPWVVASFTSADDPVMQEVVGLVARSSGGVPSAQSDRDAVQFLSQLYLLMRGNIAYETTPGAVIGGLLHQHLKFGRDVLRTRSGTCINTSIFFASAAEAAGLDPVIVLVPGHAFAGVRLPKSGQLFFVETTGCGGGTLETSLPFERAVESASKTFAKYAKEGPFLLIDVAEMRKRGVTPPQLPPAAPNSLEAWKIVMPAAPAAAAGPDRKPADGLGAARAVVEDVRVATDVTAEGKRGGAGRKGLLLQFRLTVTNARGRNCHLIAFVADENGKLVKSDDPHYSLDGYLTAVKETGALDSDDVRAKDFSLFIPFDALPPKPGKSQYLFVLGVVCEGQSLIEGDPPTGVFEVSR